MKTYGVVSPEIWEIEPVLDYGEGPKVYYRCYTEVQAKTKKEAIKAAIKSNAFKNWVVWQRQDNKNPFSGVIAEELPEL
jgi:hypothetical protein